MQPWLARSMPSAWTRGRPPSRSRTPAGDAARDRHVGRGELDVEGDERAPGARPRWRPPSDAAVAARSRARRSGSAWPPRDPRSRAAGCRPGRGGRAAGRPRRRGRPAARSARPAAAAKRRAPSTHCSMVVSPSGTKGTTSTAPMRGWLPSLTAHVDALDRHLDGGLRGRHDTTRVAGQRVDAALVVGIGGAVEEPGAGVPARWPQPSAVQRAACRSPR